MSNKKIIENLILKSSLLENDKEQFVNLLNTISDDNLSSMRELFENNTMEVNSFWVTFRARSDFLQMIEASNLSSKEKENIKKYIISLDDEEFNILINTIKSAKGKSKEKIKENIKKISDAQKKAHKEFTIETNSFLRKLFENKKKVQAEKDDKKADEILKKIKDIKS